MINNAISKAQIKHIRLLQQKKFRQRYKQFVVEGSKSVQEFVKSTYRCQGIFATEKWWNENVNLGNTSISYVVKEKELKQISNLKNPQQVFSIFEMPENLIVDTEQHVILALDDIRDPGNLGTIIRSADWFGLNQVVCSMDSADCYNPKVVQATMGSLSRVEVVYVDLEKLVLKNPDFVLTIADMEGENFKQFKWKKNILVIGNEGVGVSKKLRTMAHSKITIPKIGETESLNAGVSASILLSSIFN